MCPASLLQREALRALMIYADRVRIKIAHSCCIDGVDGPAHRHRNVPGCGCYVLQLKERTIHMNITTIGIDLAKNFFQLHGVDETGAVILRRKLRRDRVLAYFEQSPPCLIGMEACGSAHHWARELSNLGHDAKLMPPAYVKPYIKRQKNDAADAEAICEAVARPTMRFVPVKSADGQSILLLHRTRHLLIRQRTGAVNALRAHMAEFGIIAPKGIRNIIRLIAVIDDACDARLPDLARSTLALVVEQITMLSQQITAVERKLRDWSKANEICRRLQTIPGIGFITATALAASVADAGAFRSARHFAAWLGLVPRQNSTGGKQRLGRISKMGDRYIRQLLVNGAMAIQAHRPKTPSPLRIWSDGLSARKSKKLVAVAVANKLARIAWAVMANNEDYRRPEPGAA